jgi:hypothetical protein
LELFIQIAYYANENVNKNVNKKDSNDKSYCLDGQVCIEFGVVDLF